jgi:hypothetical protein
LQEIFPPGWDERLFYKLFLSGDVDIGADGLVGAIAEGWDRILQVLHQLRKGVLGSCEVIGLKGIADSRKVGT